MTKEKKLKANHPNISGSSGAALSVPRPWPFPIHPTPTRSLLTTRHGRAGVHHHHTMFSTLEGKLSSKKEDKETNARARIQSILPRTYHYSKEVPIFPQYGPPHAVFPKMRQMAPRRLATVL